MPEYRSPGVCVEEFDPGGKPIEGVATSTAGFLGVAERGPPEPQLVTSFEEYARRFGGYLTGRYLARAVEGFFQNGGKRCFVARVASAGRPDRAMQLADFQVGLRALEEIAGIAILCSPDEHAVAGVAGQLVDQCERLKDRFAILQAPENPSDLGTLEPPTASRYAAFYFPWIRVLDSATGAPVTIPAGGHIAGIYARNDIERGVHTAPANLVLHGLYADGQDPASGLQTQVSQQQQDVLSPRGVNLLRYFEGRGVRVWGARTTSPDPDWKYVNIRRLFIFLERSIAQGTKWAVFEPNGEPLWARLRQSVSNFLYRQWTIGLLQGRTPDEAFFVRCDRTTMTQDDLDNGRVIILVGIAPVKPAEFVIIRIGQWAGGSEVTEG